MVFEIRTEDHRIREWWAEVREPAEVAGQQLRSSGLVQDVNKLYSKADVAKYEELVPVPCRGGGVRIICRDIIHGSMASTGTLIRSTILPWYVAVSEDNFTLDVQECDN